MPFPLLGLLAGASAFAPTAMNIGSKIMKHKIGSSFVQASAFGVGYGAFTNIGYNASNKFLTSGLRNSFKRTGANTYSMFYGSRYSRYGRRPSYRSTRYSRYRRPSYRRRY